MPSESAMRAAKAISVSCQYPSRAATTELAKYIESTLCLPELEAVARVAAGVRYNRNERGGFELDPNWMQELLNKVEALDAARAKVAP